ncbi:CHAP domain-containing protein [Amycolatopsis sp. NPDC059027]|uniref:CHAP domain-containing protein n=1 Tax=unclassified Amycolatopsis TaxID=2618356 RepID=UPI0036722CC4
MRRRFTQLVTLVATMAALAVGGAGLASAADADTQATTRQKIVSIAKAEMNNADHNREKFGKNCNFYSGQVGGGTPCGPGNKWRAEAWCADFLKYVWKKAGADTAGINAGAASLYSYGKKHGTWNSGSSIAGVKAGDAIVYNLNSAGTHASHVGIVTAVNKSTGKITVISGNYGDRVDDVTAKPGGSVSGYAGPVG